MGLFNRKKQKNDQTQNTASGASQDNTPETSEPVQADVHTDSTSGSQTSSSSFVFGIEDIFHLKTENEVVVVGRVKGTVIPGAKASVINPGDDEQPVSSVVFTELEINHKKVNSATDTVVGILITIPEGFPLKIGSVFYSDGSSDEEIYKAYINAVSASYFGFRRLVIEPDNLNKMSIGDLAEVWCFAIHVIRSNKDMPEDTRKEIYSKIGPIADELIKKILSADEIFYVNNKRTGEPHLFSQTIKREKGYECTRPDILLIPKSHLERIRSSFEKGDLEILSVKNGEDGKGIYNFLGSTFYLNGACGIQVLSKDIMIDSSKVVEKPTYEGVPEISIPVTNPNLLRWMLLMGQMNEPQTDDAKLIYNLYFGFFLQELPKAKLLVPMKGDETLNSSKPDENGKMTLKKGAKISFPTIQGKKDKRAVQMFTDWKRLYMVFRNDWSGMVETVGNMIEVFDCAINATDHLAAGCYIDSDMYRLALDKQKK
jgi:hypothetical protein